MEQKISFFEQKIQDLTEKMNILLKQIHTLNTANGGYSEEGRVCLDLTNDSTLKEQIKNFVGLSYHSFTRYPGNTKVDIVSDSQEIKIQVKKFQKNQFQQLDRRKVDDVVKYIPGLESIRNVLKCLCEIPLLENLTHIDRSKKRIPLAETHYSPLILQEFLETMNRHKLDILELAFYGTQKQNSPQFLLGIEYTKKKRYRMLVFRIKDIINDMNQYSFVISKNRTVVSLGNSFSLQRKGGDGGRKSSNHLQMKIIVSRLAHLPHLEFVFSKQ